MAHPVTVIRGDGIGPEVVEAALRVLNATGVALRYDEHDVGISAMERTGDPLPESVIASVRQNGVALKGPVSTAVGTSGFRSVNVALRRSLDLFANVRPCVASPGPHGPTTGVDLVVVRDTTEDLYAGVEFAGGSTGAQEVLDTVERHGSGGRGVPRDAGLSLKYLSPAASRRIATFAFDYARRMGRRKVTAVHKASVMRATDGLFLEAVRAVAGAHPEIEFEDRLVDNLCGQLVRRAQEYDVLVMPNMYGDIVSDLAAGLIGGVGLAPGANYGEGVALFEPVHGTAPAHAGTDRANPSAMILSAAMLLDHLGEHDAAARIAAAVRAALANGVVTYDLKPRRDDPSAVGTAAFADQVIARL